MLGTTYFIFDRMPNCSACLVEAVASAPNATLTNTSAPLLPMLRRYEEKSVVPSGTSCSFTVFQPALFGKLLHRVVDAVAVGVVGHQISGLAVLAEFLGQHRRQRLRRHIGRRLGAEAVTLAVLAGGVVGAAVADHDDHVLALAELFQRDRHGAVDGAGQHDRLVVADEAGRRLDSRIGFGLAVGDLEFDLLAEHAVALFQGRNLLGDAAALVEMLDRKFEAELHVLAR